MIYPKEKEWFKIKPKNEHLALYRGDELLMTKEGHSANVEVTRTEGFVMQGKVVTHWHPVETATEIYGHADAPLSMADIQMALFNEVAEMRAVTAKAIHCFVFDASLTREHRIAVSFSIDKLAPERFKTSEEQEKFLRTIAEMFNCKYKKILLDLQTRRK